jgi:uncharacterized protein YecE (DUF72 family)
MKDQLSFDVEPSVRALPAPPYSDVVRALGEKLPRGIRFGTMTWNYPGWIGRVYAQGTTDKQISKAGLTAYVQHPLLRCAEIDRTFYGPVSAEVYAGLAAQAPAEFRFVAKAHEDCTRAEAGNTRLLDAAYAADVVVAPFIEGLRERAGVLLFQFSPFPVKWPKRFAAHLHDFLRRLPRGPVYGVELRNEALLTREYGEALADAGAVHCYNAWGPMPDVLEQRDRLPAPTRRVLLVRWLMRPNDNYEAAGHRLEPFDELREPDLERRQQIATLVRGSTDAYVLINNQAEGCAPESAVQLAAELCP